MLQTDLLGPSTLPLLLVVAGLGLSIAEALAPGAHFVVVGVSLLAAGLVGLLLGPLASPFVLAFLVLLFGGLALVGYRELDIYGGKGQEQTSDSASLKGTTGRAVDRVTPAGGRIRLTEGGGFSPYYSARTFDGEIPEGEEVMVVDPGGGNVVTVVSLGVVEDEIDRELAKGRSAEAEELDEDEAQHVADEIRRAADEMAEEGSDTRSDAERERETERESR